MKIIRLLLEYDCYPIWTYEKEGVLIDNGFPEDDKPNDRLEEMKVSIAKTYNSLFVNDAHEFSYKGFSSKEGAKGFANLLNEFRDLVKDKYSKDYKIVDDFDDFSDEAK